MSHRWTDTVRSPVALLCFAGTAVIGVVADLWSKAAAVANQDQAFHPRSCH